MWDCRPREQLWPKPKCSFLLLHTLLLTVRCRLSTTLLILSVYYVEVLVLVEKENEMMVN